MTKDQNWWDEISGRELSQGDYLKDCPVPVIADTFTPFSDEAIDITIEERDVIILTQSCDLTNNKAPFVALCPVYTLEELEAATPQFASKGTWEQVRNGRREGLHMLAGFNGPENNRSSRVVDFRQIYSLPFGFLQQYAERLGSRQRLLSPYLAHLAQSFARFFMRVGLPSAIKKFD